MSHTKSIKLRYCLCALQRKATVKQMGSLTNTQSSYQEGRSFSSLRLTYTLITSLSAFFI